jgi:hypothetical protein
MTVDSSEASWYAGPSEGARERERTWIAGVRSAGVPHEEGGREHGRCEIGIEEAMG